MDTQLFRLLGLSQREEKVYLSSLQAGSKTANDIAIISRLPRTTVYDLLKSLIEKGYMSYVIKSGVKYFEATDPSKLINKIKEMEKIANAILPDLISIKGKKEEKASVEMYEGFEGLKTMIDDILNTGKELYTISSTKDLIEKLPFYFPNYMAKRIKVKISIKLITERTEETKKLKQKDKKELRETRFLPIRKDLKNAIFIYGNKIALFNLENPSGVIIKDRSLNSTFKEIFSLLWVSSKI